MKYKQHFFNIILLVFSPLTYAVVNPIPAKTLQPLPLPNKTQVTAKTAPIDTGDQTITEEQALALLKQTSTTYEPLLLSVIVNEQDQGQEIIAYQKGNEIIINQDDFKSFGIDISKINSPIIKYLDKNYYALNSLPGSTYKMDTTQAKLHLTFPSYFFSPGLIDFQKTSKTPLSPSAFGGFINYDTSITGTGKKINQAGGLVEGGMFTKKGVGTSNFLLQNSNGQNTISRLNTTWTRDDPEKMRTFKMGDVFTDAGMWGRSALLGGVQWSTNFTTQPDFVTSPIPSTTGAAILPSTVDIYVNNALLAKEQVNPGPFAINNIPVVGGAGSVNVIVTDILGRQHVMNLPYYTSNDLLKPGLHKYSYEIGLLRTNFGGAGSKYGRPMFTGTDNVGVTDRFSYQWHTEILTNQQAIGFGGKYLIRNLGATRFAIASSLGKGLGFLALTGFQYQTEKNLISFGYNLQTTTTKFTPIGVDTQPLPSWQNQFNLSIPCGKGAIGLSYTTQNNRGQPNSKLFSASYGTTIFKNWSLTFSSLFNLGAQKSTAFSLTLTKNLTDTTSLTLSGTRQSDSISTQTIQLNRPMPLDKGFGYGLQAQMGQQKNYRATFNTQSTARTYTLEAEKQDTDFNYRGQSSGSVIFIGGHAYLAKHVNDSFGLVQVPGYKDIDIYHFNQIVAHTDKNGDAFITRLLPYQDNPIRIDVNQLPLDVKIGSPEQIVKPYYRSGVIVPFAAKITRGALLRITLPDGKDVPPDTIFINTDTKEQFFVASEGTLYLTDLDINKINHFEGPLEDQTCVLDVDLSKYKDSKDPFVDLGTIICKMIDTPQSLSNASLAPQIENASFITSQSASIPITISLAPKSTNIDLNLVNAPKTISSDLINPDLMNKVCDAEKDKYLPEAILNINLSAIACKKESKITLKEPQASQINKIKAKIKNVIKKYVNKIYLKIKVL